MKAVISAMARLGVGYEYQHHLEFWGSQATKSVAVSEGKMLQVTKGKFALMGNWPI